MNKYLYRFLCAITIIILATGSFSIVWLFFVKVNNQTGHLLGRANILMSIAIYFFLFSIIGHWLKAFKIGVERKAKIIASIALTVLVTNFIEVLVSMAITGQFRFFGSFLWRYSLLAVGQMIVFVLITVIAVNEYRKIIPPLTLLEIKGKYENNLASKMNAISYKYSVGDTIRFNDRELEQKIQQYDAVLINDIPTAIEKDILKLCFENNKRVYVVPKLSDIILKFSDDINLVDTPLFLCRNPGINRWKMIVKRSLDLFFSTLALIVLSPVFLVTAIAIKLDDKGPVFYKQERVTYQGKRFMILKFRSMIVDAEKDGRPRPAGEKDDRITKVGHIIRAARIDELPQLINIIKGDMSIVGPRPERWEHVEKYLEEIPEFKFRYKVKGGLTGYAQVYGKYNTSALDKLKMDLVYITNYRLLLDFQILFETFKIIFIKDSTEGFDQKRIEQISEGKRK